MESVQGHTYPPRTKIEETVLDLTQTAKNFDDICGWVTRAFARELTDETRLDEAMKARTKLRWRADLRDLIVAPTAAITRYWSSATTVTWNAHTACRSRTGRCRSPDRAAARGAGIGYMNTTW